MKIACVTFIQEHLALCQLSALSIVAQTNKETDKSLFLQFFDLIILRTNLIHLIFLIQILKFAFIQIPKDLAIQNFVHTKLFFQNYL